MNTEKHDFKYENLYLGLPIAILTTGAIVVAIILFSSIYDIVIKTKMFAFIGLAVFLLLYYFFLYKFIECSGTALIFDKKIDLQFKYSNKEIDFENIKFIKYWGGGLSITLKDNNKKIRIFEPLKNRNSSNLYALSVAIADKARNS